MMQDKNKLFIVKCELLHNNRYDYSLLEYKNSRTKIKIVCQEHGIFTQYPYNHIRGSGCPKCIYNKLTTKDVITQFKKIHNDNYDYSLVKYTGDNNNINIICTEHGIFKQTPSNHKRGQNCPKCVGKNLSNENIITSFKKRHNNVYDYSLINYIDTQTKVDIICPKHGIFKQRPNSHLKGHGCPRCSGNGKLDITKILENFSKTHGKKYRYSNIDYINAHTKINIICLEHGMFKQTPNNHKNGNGCPKCKESQGETKIRVFLENNNINYISQYKFDDCKNILPLPFDFYLPNLNTSIEFNGLQHYKPIEYFGGLNAFKKRKHNDKIKKEYCNSNNIPLIVINYNEKVDLKLNHLKVVK